MGDEGHTAVHLIPMRMFFVNLLNNRTQLGIRKNEFYCEHKSMVRSGQTPGQEKVVANKETVQQQIETESVTLICV